MDKVRKVLVLGTTGMLGSMVYDYLQNSEKFVVRGTARNLQDSSSSPTLFSLDVNTDWQLVLNDITKSFVPDFIVNCIGIINQYCNNGVPEGIKNAIKINSLFPYELSNYFLENFPQSRIIQIATDCVFSGRDGNYTEDSVHDALDVYGKTKSLGEVVAKNFLNIRCSIIGPEIKNKVSLLEWFLSHSSHSSIKGYSHHKWNGVTTLQFAQFCEKLISENVIDEYINRTNLVHYCPNTVVTKFELLKIFQDVFKTNFIIENVANVGYPLDRTLKSSIMKFEKNDMKHAVIELKNFILKRNVRI